MPSSDIKSLPTTSVRSRRLISRFLLGVAIAAAPISSSVFTAKAQAQTAVPNSITIEGNQRIATSTIISLAGLERGQSYNAGLLNAAVQRLNASGFFSEVDFQINGGNVTIKVVENPTINVIDYEGNKRLKDDALEALTTSQSRQTYSAARAERDAQAMAAAYSAGGRIGATITPKIIKRSDNRVDLVFQILEGRVTEIEKISIVGNRQYSDRRLRSVLETKQAGIFRAIVSSDTFIQDRIALDNQKLVEFYQNRGYVDFRVLSSTSELTRARDAFLLTFNVEEGQQYSFGDITVTTSEPDIDLEDFQKKVRIKPGQTYDPRKINTLLQELDVLASRKNLSFVSARPIVSRDDATRTVSVELDLQRGQRVFVERIDIEGNSTTKDSVIRRQFETAEGDPFDRRDIQETTDRVRNLGYFEEVSVEAREGSSPNQAVIDVDVKEQPTGNFGFGVGYNTSDGAVFTIDLTERNFLGRGQTVRGSFSNSRDARNFSVGFTDPSFLDRDLSAGFDLGLRSSTPSYAPIKVETVGFTPRIEFRASEFARLGLSYTIERTDIQESTADSVVSADVSPTLKLDYGKQVKSSIGINYSYDKRNSSVEPTAGFIFSASQEFAGLGGDVEFSKTRLNFKAYRTLFNDNIVLSAEVEGGVLKNFGSGSRITDRFILGGDQLRGFASSGVGPRDQNTGAGQLGDPLGGNLFAVARLEASFPIGLPEEYGIFGGVFFDAGSVWSLDNIAPGSVVDDTAELRTSVGVSIFWDTAIGPLRFNFAKPLKFNEYDVQEKFRFTIDTRF